MPRATSHLSRNQIWRDISALRDHKVPGHGGVIWLLAIAQLLSYACFFYVFAALLVAWQEDLAWGTSLFAAGPTLSILVAAGASIFVGRGIDLGHSGRLMPIGALIGGFSLLLLASMTAPWAYFVAFAGLGLAMSACTYEAGFAVAIRYFDQGARRAITKITLVAGLASTLSFPAGAALSHAYGWRTAVVLAALIALFVIAPLYLWVVRHLPLTSPRQSQSPKAAWQTLRDRRFWHLAALFSLINLNHWMLIGFLLVVLDDFGLVPALAVLAATTIGPAQVAGRAVLMRFETGVNTARAMIFTLAYGFIGLIFLALSPAFPYSAIGFAVMQGASMGVVTILRPTLVAETLGRDNYGAIAGLLSVPTQIASALSTLCAALVFHLWGGVGVLALSAVIVMISLGLASAGYRRGLSL